MNAVFHTFTAGGVRVKKTVGPGIVFMEPPDDGVITFSGRDRYECRRENGSACNAVCCEYDGIDRTRVGKNFVE